MKLSASCMACIVQRQEQASRALESEPARAEYLKKVMELICSAGETESAPVVTGRISRLHESFFGQPYCFRDLKRKYNQWMLKQEPALAAEIDASPDPLLAALNYSRVGNYIDFGAMGEVSDEKLAELLGRAGQETLDPAEYQAFREDLSRAARLVLCTDNCGEIVLDKLLLGVIARQFPQLDITVIVRGGEVLNDATMADAEEIGLLETYRVLENGNDIAGTHLPALSPEAAEAVRRADVLIAKGQGNFESLHGCGLNFYYLFLCKCDWFTRRFGLERFQGVFINEKNQKIQ